MKHIDEHILELYILGDARARKQRRAIEKHIRECAGCRELAEKMQSLYADVAEELHNLEHTQMESNLKVDSILTTDSTSLIQTQKPENELWHKPKMPVAARWSVIEKWTPRTLQNFWFVIGNFVYRRPIIATGASLVFLVALIFFVNIGIDKIVKDDNPSYYHIDVNEGKIEIFNKSNQKLWDYPTKTNLQFIRDEPFSKKGPKKIEIFDIDNDGKNEFITNLPSANEYATDTWIRVFSYKGNLKFEIKPKIIALRYKNNQYSSAYIAHSFSVLYNPLNKQNELLVNEDNGRSPRSLARYDNTGNELGRYFHYGHFNAHYIETLTDFNNPMVLLVGNNDTEEENDNRFPIIIVLDPTKIMGMSCSSATPNFNLPISNSEHYYISFPKSEMATVLKTSMSVRSLQDWNDNSLHLWVRGSHTTNLATKEIPSFEYIFSKSMDIVDVKWESATNIYNLELLKQGKVKHHFTPEYMNELKSEIRYWDGTKWQKTKTGIMHNKIANK